MVVISGDDYSKKATKNMEAHIADILTEAAKQAETQSNGAGSSSTPSLQQVRNHRVLEKVHYRLTSEIDRAAHPLDCYTMMSLRTALVQAYRTVRNRVQPRITEAQTRHKGRRDRRVPTSRSTTTARLWSSHFLTRASF